MRDDLTIIPADDRPDLDSAGTTFSDWLGRNGIKNSFAIVAIPQAYPKLVFEVEADEDHARSVLGGAPAKLSGEIGLPFDQCVLAYDGHLVISAAPQLVAAYAKSLEGEGASAPAGERSPAPVLAPA